MKSNEIKEKRIIKDVYGNVLKSGDVISMPYVTDDYTKDEIIEGYYITKLSYSESRDTLIDSKGMGIRLAYGVVKLNR